MVKEVEHIASGENLEPHDTNPASAREAAEQAMAKATKEAEQPAEEAPETEEQGTAELPLDTVPPADQPAESPPGDLVPPSDWSAEDQAIFKAMDNDTQAWQLARDKAVRDAYEQRLSALTPWEQVQQQWNPYFQQLGGNVPQLMNGLLQTEHTLRTGTPQQKAAMLQHIAQSYGVQLAQQQDQVPEELSTDPVYSAVNPQLQEVMQRLDNLQSQVGQNFGAMQAQQIAQANNAVEAFWNEADDKGQPKHPYRNEVEPLMTSIADLANRSGQQPTLEQVYQQACWAHDGVRAQLQNAGQADALADRQRKAAEKQAASKSVSGSPGGQRKPALEPKKGESVHETALRAMQLHSGGGHA